MNSTWWHHAVLKKTWNYWEQKLMFTMLGILSWWPERMQVLPLWLHFSELCVCVCVCTPGEMCVSRDGLFGCWCWDGNFEKDVLLFELDSSSHNELIPSWVDFYYLIYHSLYFTHTHTLCLSWLGCRPWPPRWDLWIRNDDWQGNATHTHTHTHTHARTHTNTHGGRHL